MCPDLSTIYSTKTPIRPLNRHQKGTFTEFLQILGHVGGGSQELPQKWSPLVAGCSIVYLSISSSSSMLGNGTWTKVKTKSPSQIKFLLVLTTLMHVQIFLFFVESLVSISYLMKKGKLSVCVWVGPQYRGSAPRGSKWCYQHNMAELASIFWLYFSSAGGNGHDMAAIFISVSSNQDFDYLSHTLNSGHVGWWQVSYDTSSGHQLAPFWSVSYVPGWAELRERLVAEGDSPVKVPFTTPPR